MKEYFQISVRIFILIICLIVAIWGFFIMISSVNHISEGILNSLGKYVYGLAMTIAGWVLLLKFINSNTPLVKASLWIAGFLLTLTSASSGLYLIVWGCLLITTSLLQSVTFCVGGAIACSLGIAGLIHLFMNNFYLPEP